MSTSLPLCVTQHRIKPVFVGAVTINQLVLEAGESDTTLIANNKCILNVDHAAAGKDKLRLDGNCLVQLQGEIETSTDLRRRR